MSCGLGVAASPFPDSRSYRFGQSGQSRPVFADAPTPTFGSQKQLGEGHEELPGSHTLLGATPPPL
eukprot:5722194-Prorocentrum_lima.AAC.1